MTVLSKRMAKPHCDKCTRRKEDTLEIAVKINVPLLPKDAASNVEDLKKRLKATLDGMHIHPTEPPDSKDENDML